MLYSIPDAALLGGGYIYDSRANAILASVNPLVQSISTNGYYSTGDGGGANFKRATGPFMDGASFKSADGAWWQLCSTNVNVNMFGAVGDGVTDDTDAINNALSFVGNNSILYGCAPFNYYCNNTITFSNNNTIFDLNNSQITYNDPTLNLILMSGASSQIINGVINAPAIFDGTNAPLTYAIVQITADNCSVEKIDFNNVPRCGIWFNEANSGKVLNNNIDGGTTEGFFTGSNTVHFGIGINPASTDPQGNFIISGNFIERCVQGCSSGNIGAASYEQSYSVVGNVFTNCWNHGFYTSGLGNGHSIVGNAFNACQTPVAVTGSNHVISGNTLVVQTTGTGAPTDVEITGISLRDPVACIVSDNSIKGEGTSAGVVIGFDDLALVSGNNRVEGNICANNTIEITNTTVAGVTVIRMYSDSGNPVKNNIIEGNLIKAPMRNQDGLIEILAAVNTGQNNVVRNNDIIITGSRGNCSAILISNCINGDVSGNTISLEFDAASAQTNSAILNDSGIQCSINNNKIRCSADWGANITFRGIQEVNSASNNRIYNNSIFLDTTKLSGADPLILFGTTILDHTANGSPEGSIVASVGSRWWRADGGAATTLYVKESGASNTGWVGK